MLPPRVWISRNVYTNLLLFILCWCLFFFPDLLALFPLGFIVLLFLCKNFLLSSTARRNLLGDEVLRLDCLALFPLCCLAIVVYQNIRSCWSIFICDICDREEFQNFKKSSLQFPTTDANAKLYHIYRKIIPLRNLMRTVSLKSVYIITIFVRVFSSVKWWLLRICSEMSQHMAGKYLREFRKRARERQVEVSPKQPRTVAERVRCHRANKKAGGAVRGNASPTIGWDAGEGPSTRGRKVLFRRYRWCSNIQLLPFKTRES